MIRREIYETIGGGGGVILEIENNGHFSDCYAQHLIVSFSDCYAQHLIVLTKCTLHSIEQFRYLKPSWT